MSGQIGVNCNDLKSLLTGLEIMYMVEIKTGNKFTWIQFVKRGMKTEVIVNRMKVLKRFLQLILKMYENEIFKQILSQY